jgi:hypothetical protein
VTNAAVLTAPSATTRWLGLKTPGNKAGARLNTTGQAEAAPRRCGYGATRADPACCGGLRHAPHGRRLSYGAASDRGMRFSDREQVAVTKLHIRNDFHKYSMHWATISRWNVVKALIAEGIRAGAVVPATGLGLPRW